MKYQPMNRPHRLATVVAAAGLISLISGSLTAQEPAGVPANPDDRAIVHVLNRLGFGPGPGGVDEVRAMGLAAWIETQLHPERIADNALAARLATMPTLSMSTRELAEAYFIPAAELRRRQQQAQRQAASDPAMTPPTRPAGADRQMSAEARQIRQDAQRVSNELMQAKMLRGSFSERQLEEVLVDFWFNHFNVFIGKGQVRQYLTEYERDAIRPHVLGSFRDMLGATAKSPAMLFYLDNFQSQADNPPAMRSQLRRGGMRPPQRPAPPQRRARGLNENYAREPCGNIRATSWRRG
jgi:uncharacterized protein (DUF1800 family)